jgi:hypothetical protein
LRKQRRPERKEAVVQTMISGGLQSVNLSLQIVPRKECLTDGMKAA